MKILNRRLFNIYVTKNSLKDNSKRQYNSFRTLLSNVQIYLEYLNNL